MREQFPRTSRDTLFRCPLVGAGITSGTECQLLNLFLWDFLYCFLWREGVERTSIHALECAMSFRGCTARKSGLLPVLREANICLLLNVPMTARAKRKKMKTPEILVYVLNYHQKTRATARDSSSTLSCQVCPLVAST